MKLTLHRAAQIVVALSLSYFAIEVVVALASGSVSLFADSVDFLEDASINLLMLLGLGWSVRARGRLGVVLAGIILVPGVATLAMAWQRYSSGTPPEPLALGVTAFGAMLVNGICTWLLASHRGQGGSLVKAAFLSARNDVLANIAMIGAGLATAISRSLWPDLIVGLAIVALNAGAAWEVFEAATEEHRSQKTCLTDGDCS